MLEDLTLTGRSVVVTGGGRGLGRAMAKALAKAGANVLVAANARAGRRGRGGDPGRRWSRAGLGRRCDRLRAGGRHGGRLRGCLRRHRRDDRERGRRRGAGQLGVLGVPRPRLRHRPRHQPQEQLLLRQRGERIPVRRIGEWWELGPLAVYLASDASRYVTGQLFIIDGGGLAGGIGPTGFVPSHPDTA